eukprot:TRINITY_DN3299_c0_g1_i2.p1 TRINITY_DN3299_c0_g1~~TRINITY_DN3299_c0_g1_i2.p1  ORF type:complete len:695 (+),score=139.24 TRINITY_DN3299_c0_g1_i2:127-2211(+)
MSYYTKSIVLLLCVIQASFALVPRTLNIINQCENDYHWLVTTGADATADGTVTCAAGCNPWSSCNTDNGKCYFKPPTYNGTLGMVAAGQTIQMTFHNYGSDTLWSGNVGFCQSGANCLSSSKSIYLGMGLIANDLGPANLAEFTMLNQGLDYYDISNINGISASFEFGPVLQNECTNNGDPYFCGVAGAVNPINSELAPSFWNFSNPDIRYKWVIPTSNPPVTCSQENPSCPNGLTCGLNLTYTTDTPQLVCGTQYGWWTADQLCAASPSINLFQCNDFYTFNGANTKYRELYGCTKEGSSGSCYSLGAQSDCCGCADWNDVFGYKMTPQITMPCQNTNSYWTQTVLPSLTWLKAACPTCYTYPYDDKSSSFTCAIWDESEKPYNTQNYTITLCPKPKAAVSEQQGNPDACPNTNWLCSYTSYYDTLYYLPSQSTCYENEYLCTQPTEALCLDDKGNHNCFDASSQSCDNGFLCGLGQHACINNAGQHACYSPSAYCCVGGNLYQIADPTCTSNTAATSTTGSGVVVVSGSGATVNTIGTVGLTNTGNTNAGNTNGGTTTTTSHASTSTSTGSTSSSTGNPGSSGTSSGGGSGTTTTTTTTTTGNPVVALCNGTSYNTTLFSCYDGIHLCKKGLYACVQPNGKFTCYVPDTHSCAAGIIADLLGSDSPKVPILSFNFMVLLLVAVEVFVVLVAI